MGETRNQFAWPIIQGTIVRIDGQWMKVRGILKARDDAPALPEGMDGILTFVPCDPPDDVPATGFVSRYGVIPVTKVPADFASFRIEIPRPAQQ